jgi:hypothetical protein
VKLPCWIALSVVQTPSTAAPWLLPTQFPM